MIAPQSRTRSAPEAGFSTLEALFAIVLGVIGLLAHISTTMSERRLSESSRLHSEGVLVLNQFVARLRGDEDWAGLYGRLRTLQVAASGAVPLDHPLRLDDGRKAYPPTTYYADFAPTVNLEHVGVLVEVPPRAPPADAPLTPPRLREDWTMPRFGLPYDLNGDGLIGGQSVEDDYVLLPVRVILRWTPRGARVAHLQLDTWIRGNR